MCDLLIANGNVIDGAGNAVKSRHSVAITGDRITHIGIDIEPGAETQVIDAAGMTVMPGLIDAHCHMTYGESFTQEEQDLYTSVEGRTLRAAWNVQKVLQAGVTSISQPGGSYFIGVAVREGIDEGRIVGPRMSAAGRYITTSNGLVDFYPDAAGSLARDGSIEGGIGIRCNTLDEMIAEVRHQVKNGVDFIKLADSAFGEFQSFRGEELRVIADLAHQLGRPLTIHARGDAEVLAAAEAGFDWIMHGNIMSERTVAALAEREILLVPTLVLLHNWAEYGPAIGSPRPIIDGCKRILERTRASLHMAHEAGVMFALGTDTGFAMTPYGEWHAKELELLMDYAGLTQLEAVQAGTSNGAVTVGLEGEVGLIAPGALADVLVVDGDPLEDIAILQNPATIRTIIRGGNIIEKQPELESWPNKRSLTYADKYLTRIAVASLNGDGEPQPADGTHLRASDALSGLMEDGWQDPAPTQGTR